MAGVQAIAIGCSAGGLRALQRVLPGLHAQLPVPVVVVCHTGSEDVATLCDLLGRRCPLPVVEARERHRPRQGVVHVAPSGYHLLVEGDGHFALNVDAKVRFVRPAIDVLFASAADAWGAGLVAVVLTGANDDGADGLRSVRDHGGTAIIQDPAEAEAREMPLAALARAGADHVLGLDDIASKLNLLCHC